MPFFSIITPTYNREKFIFVALQSVLEQTFIDWEYIIIDDGSIDNTKEVIKNCTDDRVFYVYQENQERSAARNNGIKLAKGQYICFLDSDDYYLENHLQVLYQKILEENKEEALYYTQSNIHYINTKKISPVIQNTNSPKLNFIFNNFLFINSICVSASIMKQKQFKFPINYSSWEDLYVWFQVIAKYPIHFISTRTTVINVHESNSINIFISKDISYIQQRFKCIDELFTKLASYFTNVQKKKYIHKDAYSIIRVLIKHNQLKKSIILFLYLLKKYFDIFSIKIYIKIILLFFEKKITNYFQ